MKAKAFLWLVALAFLPSRLSAAELALQVLHEFFPDTGPSYTFQQLLEEADGSFLGVSRNTGSCYSCGTVYRITRSGQVTLLHSFDYPYSGPHGLSRMPDGNLCAIVSTTDQINVAITILKISTNDWSVSTIGTSEESFTAYPTFDGVVSYVGPNFRGDYDMGQIFRLTTNGSFTSLFSFNGTNGSNPNKVIIGSDGLLYGTTAGGGHGFNGSSYSGYGTVFKLTTNGALTTLAYFDLTNGASPYYAQLTLGSDQRFYGTTRGGGTNGGHGTVFRVSTNGVLESLWSFDGTNGGRPAIVSGLVQALNGKFYGLTTWGAVNTNAPVDGKVGTIFSITTNGEMSVVARFNGTNIAQPSGNMILASDGNIYGVAADERVYPSLDGNTGIFFRLAQVPEITSVIHTNGVTRLEWTSFTNGVYQIQSRPTLGPTNWTPVSSNLTATSETHSFTVSSAGALQSYYRVALLP